MSRLILRRKLTPPVKVEPPVVARVKIPAPFGYLDVNDYFHFVNQRSHRFVLCRKLSDTFYRGFYNSTVDAYYDGLMDSEEPVIWVSLEEAREIFHG